MTIKFKMKKIIILLFLANGLFAQNTPSKEVKKDTTQQVKQRTIEDVPDIELITINATLQEEAAKINQQLDIINKELKRRVELFKSKNK